MAFKETIVLKYLWHKEYWPSFKVCYLPELENLKIILGANQGPYECRLTMKTRDQKSQTTVPLTMHEDDWDKVNMAATVIDRTVALDPP